MKDRSIQISCDGGAATGKSTGAKLISKKYKLKFLSSGLLYRYAAKLILDNEQEQMPKAINKRTSDGKSIPTTFEDMYPFLPKIELKSNML